MINLNVHSEYSLLSSTLKLTEYINFGIEHKLVALALTDKNTMFGTMHFYQLCQQNGIKPIIGIDIDVVYQDFDNQIQELLVIAKDYSGYQNLCQISSIIMTNPHQTISHLQLLNYLKQVIIIVKPSNSLLNKLPNDATILADYEKRTNIYWGIDQGNASLMKHYLDHKKSIIPCQLVKYLYGDDSDSLQIITAIKEQKPLTAIPREIFEGYSYELSNDIYNPYIKELNKNLKKIIDSVNLEIPVANKQHILQYDCPKNQSSNSYLEKLCFFRLKQLQLQGNIKYLERLHYELDVITKMGFSDYFLIVWDYVLFARKQNILIGPGRGSVASSLVAYLLQITSIDPILYDLIFERFLNPERVSLPDIDIDFPDERREEVIQYLVAKYGQDHVAQIITFQTITCKIAIKDVARVLEMPLDIADKISKSIPLDLNFDLLLAINKIDVLQVMASRYPILFSLANKIIGLPRNFGTHAAGIVLSQIPLNQIVPITSGYNNMFLTQYSMNYLEQLGLLKMDLLGLRNLTIITQILQMIKQNMNVIINLDSLPLNDRKTYELLDKGDTNGIFQLESEGMKRILTTIQPRVLEDIVATSSLFRPGPQDYIKSYIKRKLKQESIVYLHPDLEPILASTYGIIVYQEQILLIVAKISNFSFAKADILRRAIGKKNLAEIKQLENEFISNGVRNGYQLKIVQQIYHDIIQFANYGFNKAHAVAYSLLGYWMAYLKSNYSLYFLSALLNSVIGSDDKISQYVKECRKYNINVLKPSVNSSYDTFISEEGNNLRYPLIAIKQVGRLFYERIKKERDVNGLFANYFEFVARMNLDGLNKRILEALIGAGALDEFNLPRKTLKDNITSALRYANLIQVKVKDKIILNYEMVPLPQIKIEKDSLVEKSQDELKYLGFFLVTHPLIFIRKKLKLENDVIKLQNLEKLINRPIRTLVIINKIKQIKTKNGDYMAFLNVSDDYGAVDVTIFSSLYRQYQHLLKENVIILIDAKVEVYNSKIHLVLFKLKVCDI